MPETFDLDQYFSHLRARWRVIALSCGLAALLAFGLTLLREKQYTATASLVIEPPAGSDLRAAMAVSPIYLESLRTYEHFALSDELFQRAIDRFDLRAQAPQRSVESWKSGILRADIPRNTKILELSVTLPDPEQAHAMAGFLAAEVVQLNRDISGQGDQELIEDAGRQLEDSRAARDKTEQAWTRFIAEQPIEPLEGEIDALETRQYYLERALLEARAGGANNEGSAVTEAPQSARAAESTVSRFQKQLADLEQELAAKRALLEQRVAAKEQLEQQRASAIATHESVLARATEIKGSVGYRGERLRVVDRGMVPETPSSPSLFLNVLAALLFAGVLSIAYLTVVFPRRARRPAPLTVHIRPTGTGDD